MTHFFLQREEKEYIYLLRHGLITLLSKMKVDP